MKLLFTKLKQRRKSILILLLAGLFVFLSTVPACEQLGLTEEEDDNTLTLLLLLGLANQNNNSSTTCSNKSGMVVCIPPGFVFE
ncbi:MAG: hypothetical protein KDK27_19150 [Leptospiraceae bacterium]|nr:hypothetical protein [Leptospiraceae bacterium]